MNGPLKRDPWSPLLWAGLTILAFVILTIMIAGSPDAAGAR